MALNKQGINITPDSYWNDFDIPTIQAAVNVAQFPKEVEDWIWEKDYSAFEVIKR